VRVTGALLARFQGVLSLLARTSQDSLLPTLRQRRATGVLQVTKREFPPKVSGPSPSGLKARFGSFQLLPRQRLLLDAGKRVPIGSRALDILMLLIERAGEVVTKEEIMTHAWPRTIVEETNLRVHIAGLRRALGDDQTTGRYLSNVIGRGYSFVESVIWESDLTSASPAASTATPPSRSVHSFPIPLTRIIGRSKDIDLLTSTLPQRRFLTILGAGGVGKSTLARAVGFELRDHYRQGAYLVDLGAIADAASLPVSLALAMGISVSVNDPMMELCMCLRDRHVLVVLDNCDHLISAAAKLAESILQSAADAHILASSREPLGAQGEWQHRLDPLEVPQTTELITAAAARSYPAVELFVERAATGAQGFELTDSNGPVVSSICRRLDGVPLAIELAAARVSVLGIQGLAVRLDERFVLDECGRRTATPRHQTLRAAIDWSYDLLVEPEQVILRRLAIFRAAFSVDSAIDIAAHGEISAEQALLGIISLADKSFIITDITEQSVRHRLLNTTRSYALGKLTASNDKDEIFVWHAQHYLDLLRRAAMDYQTKLGEERINKLGFVIDDVRAALQWAFSPRGNSSLGAQLMVASVSLELPLAHLDEWRTRVEHALEQLADLPSSQAGVESQLNTVLNLLPATTEGSDGSIRTVAANAELSETSAVIQYQIQPLINAVVVEIEGGRYGNAVAMAGRLRIVTRGMPDASAGLIADRLMAQAQHYAGQHRAARELAEKVMRGPSMVIPLTFSRFSLDAGVSMRILLARVLWIEGLVDQAARVADECLVRAESDSSYSLCQALALAACPIHLWRGDNAGSVGRAAQLRERAMRHRHGRWQPYAEWYGALANRLTERDLSAQEPAPEPPISAVSGLLLDTILTVHPETAANDDAALVRGGLESWCAAELLRRQATCLLGQEAPHERRRAEDLLLTSLDLARGQNALSWELRTASSLGALWETQNRHREALNLLSDVYARFTEGHQTQDLRQAKALLRQLDNLSGA
jgi:predicted ATPase/DNA-binding winged helix-turn-helix (wHTH) protein